jgi:hypothetical protein
VQRAACCVLRAACWVLNVLRAARWVLNVCVLNVCVLRAAH